jgi:hypothetical protein
MIEIRFKACCCICNNLDPDYQQTSGLGELVTVIGCRHSHVCGKYLAEPEETEEAPPQDVTVKGFHNADG